MAERQLMLINVIALAVAVAVFLIGVALWPPSAGPPRHGGPGAAGADFPRTRVPIPPTRHLSARKSQVTIIRDNPIFYRIFRFPLRDAKCCAAIAEMFSLNAIRRTILHRQMLRRRPPTSTCFPSTELEARRRQLRDSRSGTAPCTKAPPQFTQRS